MEMRTTKATNNINNGNSNSRLNNNNMIILKINNENNNKYDKLKTMRIIINIISEEKMAVVCVPWMMARRITMTKKKKVMSKKIRYTS